MSEMSLRERVLDKLADESMKGTTWADWKRGERVLIRDKSKQAIKTKDVERVVDLALEEVKKEIDKWQREVCKGFTHNAEYFALEEIKERLALAEQKAKGKADENV